MRPRLLVAGVGPLPPEAPGRLHAPGLRIWGIARELARAGHPVRLACARFGEAAAGGGPALVYDLDPGPGATLPEGRQAPMPPGGWPALLAREAAAFGAEAAVGSTDIMNHALARAGLALPIWMDYFGDPMAEAQLVAQAHRSDAGLARQWSLLAPALARGDRFSGCSREQRAAIWAELALTGRLGSLTATEPLVHVIPPWIEPIPMATAAGGTAADLASLGHPGPIVRGVRCPADAILAIQTGGFNTWLDINTLLAGLERAMAAAPRLHFAATGGAIPGHHVGGFEVFRAAVERSPWRERFHLLGWVPLAQVPALIAEADLALNIDFPCAEGRLGTRNRLMDWLLGGSFTISTPGSELAEELAVVGGVRLVPHGEPTALAGAILEVSAELANDPGAVRAAVARGADHLRRAHAPEVCLAPLLAWAESPQSASDLRNWNTGAAQPSALWTEARDAEAAHHAERYQAERLAWLERKLARMEGSALVRWALRLRGRARAEAELHSDPPPAEP